jgi:hypothetical protein
MTRYDELHRRWALKSTTADELFCRIVPLVLRELGWKDPISCTLEIAKEKTERESDTLSFCVLKTAIADIGGKSSPFEFHVFIRASQTKSPWPAPTWTICLGDDKRKQYPLTDHKSFDGLADEVFETMKEQLQR